MSKYKVGDKFIIEIKHGIVDPLYGARYFIKGFNTLVFDDFGLDQLKRFDGDAKVKQDEIKVGDEVMGVGDGDAKGIVTNICEDRMYILWGDGSAGKFINSSDLFKKTGRHFYIKSIFEQLRGVDEEV